jgi:hypothetical protein
LSAEVLAISSKEWRVRRLGPRPPEGSVEPLYVIRVVPTGGWKEANSGRGFSRQAERIVIEQPVVGLGTEPAPSECDDVPLGASHVANALC